MTQLRVVEFLSLDGVIQAPGSPEEDTEGGFAHGGWQRQYFDEALAAAAADGTASTDAYVFGRKTYEAMAAYWPTVSDQDPYARHLNAMPKYVASRTLRSVAWKGAMLLEGDVLDAVAELKRRDGGNIVVLGSGELVRGLLADDLVDELFLVVYPIVLGSGKRLLARLTARSGCRSSPASRPAREARCSPIAARSRREQRSCHESDLRGVREWRRRRRVGAPRPRRRVARGRRSSLSPRARRGPRTRRSSRTSSPPRAPTGAGSASSSGPSTTWARWSWPRSAVWTFAATGRGLDAMRLRLARLHSARMQGDGVGVRAPTGRKAGAVKRGDRWHGSR